MGRLFQLKIFRPFADNEIKSLHGKRGKHEHIRIIDLSTKRKNRF